jgi:hypothetical protein
MNVLAGNYTSIPLQVHTIEGFYLFQTTVGQAPQRVDDIIVNIFDEPAFRIWEHNREAIKRGASPNALPSPKSLLKAKVVSASLSFIPPAPGTFYLVLDNTHSQFTAKNLQVRIHWIWTASPLIFQLHKRLTELGWKEVWSLLSKAIGSMREKELKQCCDWLRTGLLTLWIDVVEFRTKRKPDLDAGKTPDIGELAKLTVGIGVPDYMVTPLRVIWSLASELAHTEKRGGQEPQIDYTVFAYDLTLAAAGFLLSLTSAG